MVLRHGSIEGLKELSKHFQLIIFTMLNEKFCNILMNLLDKEEIVFDGIYSRLKALRKSDEYCNYNQIYKDFDLLEDNTPSKIQNSVLIVAPLCLDNDDIKDKQDDAIL